MCIHVCKSQNHGFFLVKVYREIITVVLIVRDFIVYTVEPLYNEDSGITNDILHLSNGKMEGKGPI